jgi:hypothetical protein
VVSLPYSSQFVKRLDEACQVHNARKTFFAEDEKGQFNLDSARQYINPVP